MSQLAMLPGTLVYVNAGTHSGDPKGGRHLVAPAAFLLPVVGPVSSNRQVFMGIFSNMPSFISNSINCLDYSISRLS